MCPPTVPPLSLGGTAALCTPSPACCQLWLLQFGSSRRGVVCARCRLALVEVALTPPEVLTAASPSLAGAELVLGAPGMQELRVRRWFFRLGASLPGKAAELVLQVGGLPAWQASAAGVEGGWNPSVARQRR